MLISPLTVFWLLLVGGAIVVALAQFRSHFVNRAAAATAVLASIVWLLLKSRVPIALSVLEWPELTGLGSWNWRVDGVAWQLCGLLLAVALVGLLTGLRRENSGEQELGAVPNRSVPPAALILLLTLAGLVAIWANSLAGLLTGWALLIPVWAATLLAKSNGFDEAAGKSLPKIGWLMLSLFFIWLAAATMPVGMGQDLDMGQWTRVPTSSMLTAALLQMGVWPFLGWRTFEGRHAPAIAAILHVVPAIVGASLLARVVATSNISEGYTLYLTAFGLLGLLFGVQRAWAHTSVPTQAAVVLTRTQVSLSLLAGVWAGVDALTAEMRVMALAAGLFFFLPTPGRHGFRRWQTFGAGVALAALMGLPLTAGFAGRTATLNALLEDDRLVLTLAIGLMMAVLAGAIVFHMMPRPGTSGPSLNTSGSTGLIRDLVEKGAFAVLVVGLFSLSGLSGSAVRPVTWLALGLPILGALLTLRYNTVLREAGGAVRRAFPMELPLDATNRAWRSLGQLVSRTGRDVAHILEGDGGLLWVLILAIVIMLFR